MPFYLSRAQNVDSLEVRAMMLFSVAHVKGNPTNTLNYETGFKDAQKSGPS